MRLSSISTSRRICQLACFVALVYSGFLLGNLTFGNGYAPDRRTAETDAGLRDNVLFTEGQPSLIETFPPSAICFFVKGHRLVKGCNVYLISDALTRQTALSAVLPAVLVFVLLSFLAGRWWCGWVCPLGSMGDALDALRRRVRMRHLKYSESCKKSLRASSYAVLAATAVISFVIGLKPLIRLQKHLYLPFCEVCPARLACPVLAAGMPSFTGSFATTPHCIFTVLMYGLLAFFVAGFFAARRIWCHFCPIGLTTSWFNRGGAIEIGKEDARCNKCGACVEACPMGCEHLIEKEQRELLNSHDCIFCLRCVEQCPKEDCLSLRLFGLRLVRSRLRRM